MHLTAKQLELMRVITDVDGIDLDEILDSVRYLTSKESLQFSLRALIKRGLIEKKGLESRRGRTRMVIIATPLGKNFRSLKPEPVSRDDGIVSLGEEMNLADVVSEDVVL